MRRTLVQYGVLRAILEEWKKLVNVVKYDGATAIGETKDAVQQFTTTIKGQNSDESELESSKREKHRTAMADFLQHQRERERLEQEKRRAERAALPLFKRMKANFADLREAAAAATSTQAGVVALVQHCTAAHAAEVAVEQGIDVKNVSIVTEKSALGQETVVVGYIDAPQASEEEVMAYAEKLEKACPAAQLHGRIEWRQRPTERHFEERRDYSGKTHSRSAEEELHFPGVKSK